MELCRRIKDALEEKGAVLVVTRDSWDFPTEIDQKRATLGVEWTQRSHRRFGKCTFWRGPGTWLFCELPPLCPSVLNYSWE